MAKETTKIEFGSDAWGKWAADVQARLDALTKDNAELRSRIDALAKNADHVGFMAKNNAKGVSPAGDDVSMRLTALERQAGIHPVLEVAVDDGNAA